MFHLELRQFPHNTHAFNLTESELLALAVPWAHERWIELGERKWSPNQARMTVLEGPRLKVTDLALGRGWRNAQRVSEDVTKRVLAKARAWRPPPEPGGAGAAPEPTPRGAGPGLARSAAPESMPPAALSPPVPLGTASASRAARARASAQAELGPLLGDDPLALLQAWRLAAERRPELSPSESLALAEATLRALDADSS
jgi:hypothetical protein